MHCATEDRNLNSVDTCFSVNYLIISLASILKITNAISRFVLVCVVMFFLLGLVITCQDKGAEKPPEKMV